MIFTPPQLDEFYNGALGGSLNSSSSAHGVPGKSSPGVTTYFFQTGISAIVCLLVHLVIQIIVMFYHNPNSILKTI